MKLFHSAQHKMMGLSRSHSAATVLHTVEEKGNLLDITAMRKIKHEVNSGLL